MCEGLFYLLQESCQLLLVFCMVTIHALKASKEICKSQGILRVLCKWTLIIDIQFLLHLGLPSISLCLTGVICSRVNSNKASPMLSHIDITQLICGHKHVNMPRLIANILVGCSITTDSQALDLGHFIAYLHISHDSTFKDGSS